MASWKNAGYRQAFVVYALLSGLAGVVVGCTALLGDFAVSDGGSMDAAEDVSAGDAEQDVFRETSSEGEASSSGGSSSASSGGSSSGNASGSSSSGSTSGGMSSSSAASSSSGSSSAGGSTSSSSGGTACTPPPSGGVYFCDNGAANAQAEPWTEVCVGAATGSWNVVATPAGCEDCEQHFTCACVVAALGDPRLWCSGSTVHCDDSAATSGQIEVRCQ